MPFLSIGAVFFFLLNSLQGGGSRVMQFGKSKAKVATKDTPKTTFADVAGVEEAIEELQEIKEFLAEPAKFRAVGAKIPKGVLLYGPPGTGKTLLARAVAGGGGGGPPDGHPRPGTNPRAAPWRSRPARPNRFYPPGGAAFLLTTRTAPPQQVRVVLGGTTYI